MNFIYIQGLFTSYAFATLCIGSLKTNYKTGYKYLTGITLGWIGLFGIIYIITIIEKRDTMEDYNKSIDVGKDNLPKVRNHYELMFDGSSALFKIKSEINKYPACCRAQNNHLKSHHPF